MTSQHSSASTANSGKSSVFDGSTESVVYSGDMSPNSVLEYRMGVITPALGRWDQAGLNGLAARIGYASSVASLPYWDGLLPEFNIGR